MAVFLFYPRLHDGACLTFVSASLADDAKALHHADLVLADHASADEVAVWQGERQVGIRRRAKTPSIARPQDSPLEFRAGRGPIEI